MTTGKFLTNRATPTLRKRITAMATHTIVNLIDSINGSTDGVETVTFFHPMTGQKMTIELDEKNRKAMGTHLERMNKYFDAAEIVEVPVPASKPKASADKGELSLVREWAKENGYTVGDRGRIKGDIVEAYRKAQDAITNPDTDAQASGDEPVSDCPEGKVGCEVLHESTDDEPVSESFVLKALSELTQEGTEVSLENLKAKVDSAPSAS
jgi:hypothetical protein